MRFQSMSQKKRHVAGREALPGAHTYTQARAAGISTEPKRPWKKHWRSSCYRRPALGSTGFSASPQSY